jgi:hypothetical protein
MVQQEEMLQPNVTAKMIPDVTDNVTGKHIDNEVVNSIDETVTNTTEKTVTSELYQNDPMLHKYKYKYNLKHKLNIPNSKNSNKHKILNNDMEKENKEKVNVTLNSKETINEIAVAIAENIVEYLDKNWKEKVTQLEEVVNKQNETISLLTSRLDKASKFCADMHKQLSSQSNLSKDSNNGIADSRPYADLSIEDKNNLYEYNKAIQEFYDLKDLDIAKAEEKLHILNTLYDKLPQEKQSKISRAREVFEDKKKKNNQPHISDFRPLQSKFYATLNEGASLERDKKLIETFNAINAIDSKDNENNIEKIRQAFAKALQNEEGLKKVYRCRLITFEKLWSNAVALKEDEKAFEYAEAYIQEYLSYESQPECIRIALGMKRKIEILKLDVKRGENTLHSQIFDYYHKNRPLSPQNTEDNKDIHQEKEKPSDGLKTTKNEASKDIPADVEVIEDFKGPDEEILKQIYEQYAVAN